MEIPNELKSALSDRYEIDREIGAGGMANVYLARDVKHHRRVALKVLKPELGAILGVERFLAEIRVTANLQHPNLLPLFDSGEAGGLLYYVMPYVDGESLRGKLDREKQLPVDEAVRMATAIAGALHYAHRQGVIHRDLKPENVLLQEGQPLVTDFGIALAVSIAGGGRITQTGLSLGTPQYMSPEQATGDRTIDGRTDVYSLGAMLYEMLAGDPPYHASTSQAIIAKVITENVPDVRVARPSVPESVAGAIQGALEKLPADRWSSAAEFADALQGKSLIKRMPTARTTIVGIPLVGTTRRSALALMSGLFILGALLGAFAWRMARPPAEQPTARFEIQFPATAPLANILGTPIALTPDGQTAIYVTRGPTGNTFFRRRLSELAPTPITGTDSGALPAISRDGKWIAFSTPTAIKRVPIDGGVATVIASVSNTPVGLSWSKGDVMVAGGNNRGLLTVSARGGALVPLTKVDSAHGELDHRWPVVLDDGNTILYTSWRGNVADARIGIASLKTGESKVLDLAGTYAFGVFDGQIVFARADGAIVAVPVNLRKSEVTGDPVILASGVLVGGRGPAKAALSGTTLIYQSGSGGSRLQITDSAGHPVAAVTDLSLNTSAIAARYSPDGKRIATMLFKAGNGDIWIFDLTSKTRFRLTQTENKIEDYLAWTPDGKRIVYRTVEKGRITLSSQLADGSGAPEIVQISPRAIDDASLIASVTPDGKSLVYRTVSPDGRVATLLVRSLTGDTASKKLVTAGSAGASFDVSPDGHWLTYTSNESGADEVYVTSFPERGALWPVSAGGGTAPRWASNGKAIYYVSGRDRSLVKATLGVSHGISVLGRDVQFQGSSDMTRAVRNYDISPDGKHFLFSAPLDSANTVIAVTNWRTELRKKALAR